MRIAFGASPILNPSEWRRKLCAVSKTAIAADADFIFKFANGSPACRENRRRPCSLAFLAGPPSFANDEASVSYKNDATSKKDILHGVRRYLRQSSQFEVPHVRG
jgi:hypothetical protein